MQYHWDRSGLNVENEVCVLQNVTSDYYAVIIKKISPWLAVSVNLNS